MMLAGLAPEGTREWHDRRSGLPAGATKTIVAGQYEQVCRLTYVSLTACMAPSVVEGYGRKVAQPFPMFSLHPASGLGVRNDGKPTGVAIAS